MYDQNLSKRLRDGDISPSRATNYEAADRLDALQRVVGRLTAPVDGLKTTAEERRGWAWALENDNQVGGPGVGDYTRIAFGRLIRDFNLLLAHRAADAERIKALTDALEGTMAVLEKARRHTYGTALEDMQAEYKRARAALVATKEPTNES